MIAHNNAEDGKYMLLVIPLTLILLQQTAAIFISGGKGRERKEREKGKGCL